MSATAEVPKRLAAARDRLRRLEDERAILDVMTHFCHAIDAADEEGWLDLFADDAVFGYRRRPTDAEPESVARGREELRAWFRSRAGASPAGTVNHLFVNPRIRIDGDTAEA